MAARQEWYHSIFFGIYPPEEQALQVHRLSLDVARGDELCGPRMPPDRVHVTLAPVPKNMKSLQETVDTAIEIASQVSQPPFRLTFNKVVSWNGHMRPLVLVGDEGVIGAQLLASRIRDAYVRAGVRPKGRGDINPHMTLLRDQREMEPRYVTPLSWTVTEFVLIDSLHGLGRHEVLGRWPLFA